MGRSRHVGWVAAGLVLGAGACYCIYKLTRGQRQGDRGLRLRPSRSAGEAAGVPSRWPGTAGGASVLSRGCGLKTAGARGSPVLAEKGAELEEGEREGDS